MLFEIAIVASNYQEHVKWSDIGVTISNSKLDKIYALRRLIQVKFLFTPFIISPTRSCLDVANYR